MTKQVQLRRGTTSEHAIFTGAEGELTIDTTLDIAVVHDGVTVGGRPLVGAASTQEIINKTGVGIGTSSLSKELQVIGNVDVKGDITSRSLTVRYEDPIQRVGLITATPSNKIVGVATNNIRVGYAVSGTYIGAGVSVVSIGIATVFLGIAGTTITEVTQDFTGISTGNFLTNNGTTIIGVNTTTTEIGYGVSATGVLSGTTVTGISTLNGGRITISQASTGTLGITTRTGTSSGIGTDLITSITTTSLALGDYVDYPGSIGISTITSIGANQINVSVGLGTSGSTSFTFSRIVNFVFSNLAFSTSFSFVDPFMGQANFDVLNVNNATIQQLNLTQLNGGDLNLNSTNTDVAKINIGIVTTAYIDAANINVGIATTMIVDNNYMNVGIATTMVVTASTTDLAYINVGIGTTVGISSARLDTAYISVGIGTTVGIQSARFDNAYVAAGLATYFNVSGLTTVANYVDGVPDPTSNVTIGLGKPYDIFVNTGTLGTSFTGVGTEYVAGIGTDIITGVGTNRVLRSVSAIGPANEYSTGTYVSVASTTNGLGTGARFNVVTSDGDIESLSIERGGSGYAIDDLIYLDPTATGIGLTPPTLGSSPTKTITITGVSTARSGQAISGPYINSGTTIVGVETGIILLSQYSTNTTTSSNQNFELSSQSTINLDVTGNARVTGILTVGIASITIDGGTADITGVNHIRATEFSAAQRIVVDYPLLVTYQGTLAYASTLSITGIATENVNVGYAVTNDYLLPGTVVASIGNSSFGLSAFAQNVAPTQTTTGYVETANGNKIAGIDTSNIYVGSAATGTYISVGSSVVSIGIGSVILSQNTTSPVGERIYQGTLSNTGVSTITGIATAGIIAGEVVTAGEYVLPNTTVVSIGSSDITISQPPSQVGIITQLFRFRRLDTYQFDYAQGAVITGNFYFEDSFSGISTIPNLKGKNAFFSGIGSFDTVIADTTIITSGLIVEAINVPGIGTIGNLKAAVGVVTQLSGTNISYSGLGSIGNVKIGYGNTDFLVTGNARVTGVLTVGQGSVTISGNTNEILGASNLNSKSGIVTFLQGSNLNYTGISTLNQVGLSTLSFVGINTQTLEDKTVQFKLSNTGIATNYTLTLPPNPGTDGMVLTVDTYGNLGFATAGLYENRIYVSSANGSDLYDGKTRPVQSIKKAAQLASFESFVLPPGRYLDAADQLNLNKEFIQEEVVGFITATYPGISTNPDWDRTICRRDVGYIVDAIAYDLGYSGNSRSVGAGISYWSGVGTSYVAGESVETIDAFRYIVDMSKYVINNISIADADPGGRYDDASALLTLNKDYIKAEAVGYVTAIYPGLLSNPTYNRTKCLRDVGHIVDAISYDIKYGGNYKSVGAGVSYWSGLGTSYVTGEQVETVAAFKYIAGISSYIINNITVPQSYQVGVGSTTQVKNLTIAYDATCGAGNSYGYLCCADVRSSINNYIGIITTIVGQGITAAPAIQRPVGLYQTTTSQSFNNNLIIDIEANPVGYATTSCSNVLSSISTLVGIITTIVGLGTTAAPELILPTSKSNPVCIIVEAGEYVEDNPLILYEDVAVIGDNLRNTIIRPQNAGKDLIRVRNGCYLTGFAMKDFVDAAGVPQYTFDYAVSFDDPSDPFTSRDGYAIKTSKPIITRSPYIQNCSLLSFLGANGMLVDGSKVLSPNTAIIPEESETPVSGSQPEFGKSMVAAAFTMVSFGGIGWRVINDGYSQVVSCFQIFCRYGSLAQSGGYLSITNSATNFGYYALRSTGFSQNSFVFDRGRIAATGTAGGYQTLRVVGTGRSDQDLYVTRFFDNQLVDRTNTFKPLVVSEEFNAATSVDVNNDVFNIVGHPFAQGDSVVYFGDEGVIPARIIGGLVNENQYYVQYIDSTSFKLYEDDSFTQLVNLTSTTTGINTFTKNNQEFFVKEIVEAHNNFQTISLGSTSSTLRFVSGRLVSQTVTGGTAVGYALTYNSSSRELVVSVESASGVRRNFAVTGGAALNIEDHSPVPVSIAATSVTGITTYWSIDFKVDSTSAGTNIIGISSLPENYTLNFHRPSIINSSSHTWEYSGSGIDYNALPQNGGKTDTRTQQVSELGGRVYSSGTNELGDFLIGDFITAFNRTGNIVFNNTVTIGTLDSIRLSLSGGIQIEEFSGDIGLGDNEIGGAQNKRVSTQLAIRSFLNNRLGSFIDKTVSTNAIPNSVVQLNSIGQINADLIPPKVVNYYRTIYEGGKTSLANIIPATNILSGDTVVEPINAYVLVSDIISQYLILDSTTVYDFQNGDTVTGTVSQGGAIGIVTTPSHPSYGTTGLVKGVGLTLNTLTGGSGYNVAGIYSGVQVIRNTGIGTDMTATVTVSAGGTVSQVAIQTGGRYFASGDYVSVASTLIGGRTGGSDFTVRIGSVETRLYLTLTNNQKFQGSAVLPDYISDRNAVAISTNVGTATTVTFTGTDIGVGGDVDFTNDRIIVGVSNTIFSDGDAVRYYSTGNVVGPLILLQTYYVKRVGITSVELYTNYALSTKLNFETSGTGTQSITRLGINTDTSQITFVNHGFTQGDPVQITSGGSLPTGISTGYFYFIGSKTQNTFTLHLTRSDSVLSANGLLYNTVELTDVNGAGIVTFTKQNITYTSTVNTSSTDENNWALLATSTVDAGNIVSGVISPTRLGTGSANNQTFLRGDSSYQKVVTSVGIGTTQPIGVTYTTADLAPGGVGINTYYGVVNLTLNRVASTLDTYSTLGVSQFKNSTFGITTDGSGSVYLKTLSQGGDVDAATFNGNSASYYLDINNIQGNIPITRGGTGLQALPANGAILIGNGSSYNLTATPTFVDDVTFNGGSGAISLSANADITLTSGGTWTGNKAAKIQYYSNSLYLQYTTSLILRNSAGANQFTLDSTGNTTITGTIQGTRLISTIATGTAPLTVTSTTQVNNLNAQYLGGLPLNTDGRADNANEVVRTDGNGYIQAGWINTTSGDLGVGNLLDRVYCSNDGYVRYLGLTNFKQQIGLSAKNSYHRRQSTTDSNYWVGSMGYSNIVAAGANEVFHGGSGFFDIWSGTNFPGSFTHIHGINMLHYTVNSLGSTGGSAYGWQLATKYDSDAGPFWRRCNNGSFSAWRKIWHDSNDGSGSGLDADLLDGYNAATSNSASTVAVRDGSGGITNTYYSSPYSGANSGLTRSSYAYAFGFQEGGAWTSPFPDMVFQYHTGITMAANPGYEGIRFKNDYNDNTVRFQINGGSSYTYKYTWMYTNTTGFYSDTNGAHFYPNGTSTYTQWRIDGSRNGYGGIWDNTSGVNGFMYDGSGNGGVYRQTNGRWYFYHNVGNNCMGINSSATSSSYALYVTGSVYATGTITAASDARKKTKIETVTNALDKVNQLRGVTYKRTDIKEDDSRYDKVEMGVIAQEVEPIIPEVVTYASDVDEYAVSYGNFAGLFIEAFKEQTEIINTLKKEIEELKSKLGE